MVRSKLSMVVSLLSLLVAVGSIVTLFSVQKAGSTGHARLSPTSYDDPLPIDPSLLNYRQVAQINVGLKKVSALAVAPDDRIYVAGDMSLCRFSPDGQPEKPIALAYPPTCLAIGNQQHIEHGRIYVGFVDHVEVYAGDGLRTAIWQGLGADARFTSMSCSEHNIFIADAGQNVVQRFDWTGKLLESFGESNPGHFSAKVNGVNAPFDVAVGLDDLVYAVNRGDHRVEGYNFQGGIECHWGEGSPQVDGFAGPNSPAHLAITADGRFVTAEESPLRVKVYSRSRSDSSVLLDSVVCEAEDTGPVVAIAADNHQRILVLDGRARCVRVFAPKKLPVRDK